MEIDDLPDIDTDIKETSPNNLENKIENITTENEGLNHEQQVDQIETDIQDDTKTDTLTQLTPTQDPKLLKKYKLLEKYGIKVPELQCTQASPFVKGKLRLI